MQKIILASQSPRRKQLLEWAEVDFDVIVSDTDESFPPELSFSEAAIYIARNKALAVSAQLTNDIPVLAADTIVVCDETIFGKPKSREEAIEFLSKLSGNIHEVITGVVILKGAKEIAFADTTRVSFHALTLEQIVFYVDNYRLSI